MPVGAEHIRQLLQELTTDDDDSSDDEEQQQPRRYAAARTSGAKNPNRGQLQARATAAAAAAGSRSGQRQSRKRESRINDRITFLRKQHGGSMPAFDEQQPDPGCGFEVLNYLQPLDPAFIPQAKQLLQVCVSVFWDHVHLILDHSFFFFGYQGGRTPTGWPHTAQSGEPDCRGPEAKPHQRDTPNTPIPGGAQCPDQNSMGVEPTHLLGVLQRLPAHTRSFTHRGRLCALFGHKDHRLQSHTPNTLQRPTCTAPTVASEAVQADAVPLPALSCSTNPAAPSCRLPLSIPFTFPHPTAAHPPCVVTPPPSCT
jgi:hypothetical protein